ncbi:MAG: SMC-Scp complex subunit ScpB [Oscillospiraceae bacterium]|nr:SMC-Scp complex subunit ScpB [Oscillospiraceae bacterium]
MKASKIQSAVEAILFAAGEPVELQRIASIFEIEPELADRILYNLAAELDERNSGICLLRLGDKFQLSSRTEYAEIIRDFLELRKNTPLSQAAFEVLAVIAYNQPVTKSFVEQVRGVDCSGVITTLCQKKLIEERGRLDLPGRPLLYGTTPDFLRVFGISSLEELPPLPVNETEKTEEETVESSEQTVVTE